MTDEKRIPISSDTEGQKRTMKARTGKVRKALDRLPQGLALSDAVMHFGGSTRLAEALGVSRQLVSEWFRSGSIPKHAAVRIHELTGISLIRLLQPFPKHQPYKDKEG
jgi:transcriptional regulator with XRE-family HTH domain